MAYIGNTPEGTLSINTKEYIATEGQTTFSAVYGESVRVYVNGMLLASSDYTATDGFTIVLNVGVTAGDVIRIDGYVDIATVSGVVTSVAGKTGNVVLTEDAITDLDKYTKAEVDAKDAVKADQATTYTKDEVNTAIADALANAGIAYVAYDDRDTLRALTPTDKNSVVIGDLGLFVFQEASAEIDDDESCFATSNGRWLLENPSFDLIMAWINSSSGQSQDNRLSVHKFECPITSLGTVQTAEFSLEIADANVGDFVAINPPYRVNATYGEPIMAARVETKGTVKVSLSNHSDYFSISFSSDVQNNDWSLILIKTT